MAKEIFVAFGIDVDAVAGWLGSYGGEDSPCDISRGMFAGEVIQSEILVGSELASRDLAANHEHVVTADAFLVAVLARVAIVLLIRAVELE